ncbi:MAG: serine/threonine-protein phosphatase [Clostridiaceae bacterium]|nr:serine/threonine-protein phosphatase [Clostridiaceae bacterium]
MLIGNAQYIGTRQEQEDSFSTAEDKKVTLAVLADGMGGYSNGKLASSLAVDTFIQGFLNAESIYPVDQFLLNNANICNRAVLDKAKGKRMGSTIIAALISQGNLYWASIGDSAIVLFKNGEFINLNKKHIFEAVLEDQYVSGKITEDQLLSNPLKKRVTSYIGAEVLKEIDMNENPIKLRYGDKVLLCSDGVYNSMTEIEMEKILSKKNEPFNIAEEIIDTIRKKNLDKQDNATVVVLEYRS